MEGVAGMMEKLQLSAEERRSIKFGAEAGQDGGEDRIPQAVAKLFSERIVRSEVVEQTVGWIWCPAKGVSCKDLGDNVFLISFYQASGLRKALDDGPWMISKELLVVTEVDEAKAIDEFDFSFIPIWMRVERLPMGLMNKTAARAIGDDVGDFMAVDDDGGESAVGRVLRIKICLDVRKPLRRGIMVDLGSDKGERWCPISYEHLPEFCYICGLIGHVDRFCTKKLEENMKAPYGRELRYVPPRKPSYYKNQEGSMWQSRWSGGSGSWRAGKNDSGSSGGKSRSDGPSWRKLPELEGGSREREKEKSGEEEVTSPLKPLQPSSKKGEVAKKNLFGEGDSAHPTTELAGGGGNNVNSAMQAVHATVGGVKGGTTKSVGSFKRRKRDDKIPSGEKDTTHYVRKRKGEGVAMEIDGEKEVKRTRNGCPSAVEDGANLVDAGLSEQSCEAQ